MIIFQKPEVEKFLQTISIQNFAVSPDEKQLVFSTNISGHYNLWAMDLPNTYPYPLTFINQPSQELLYDQKGKFIIAGFDDDGNENTQFYAIPLNGGTMTEIVYHENSRNIAPFLSEDGERFYYTSSKGNPSYLNTYCKNLVTGEEELILEGNKAPSKIISLSPDESSYLYYRHFSNTNTRIYARYNDEEIMLTPASDYQYTVNDAVFISENLIYLLTDFDADFSYLASYNLQTGAFSVIKQLERESFSSLTYNKEAQILYVASEKGIEDCLYTLNLQNEEWQEIPLPCSIIGKLVVHKSGALYLLGDSATNPGNIYKRVNDEWTTLTQNKVPGFEADDLVEPETVLYESFDGLEIEALFFKAKPENDIGEIILWPHGGPQYAERKFFHSVFQILLNRGCSIFAPNFRGSTGYGLKFMKMVDGDWGHGPRLDNIAGLDWLIEHHYAEKGNIILMGGSYGGYMSLLLHGRHSEYFKAVIDICGPSDLFSFIDSVPEDWKPVMDQWVGHPERDREKLIEFSPVTYLEGMTKPMLIIQGANDPRVVKAESDQIVAKLINAGRNVEYMVLEDEGHGFTKKENEIAVYKKIVEFLEPYIVKKKVESK